MGWDAACACAVRPSAKTRVTLVTHPGPTLRQAVPIDDRLPDAATRSRPCGRRGATREVGKPFNGAATPPHLAVAGIATSHGRSVGARLASFLVTLGTVSGALQATCHNAFRRPRCKTCVPVDLGASPVMERWLGPIDEGPLGMLRGVSEGGFRDTRWLRRSRDRTRCRVGTPSRPAERWRLHARPREPWTTVS